MEEEKRQRLKGYVEKFNGKKVLVLGDIFLDEHWLGRVERLNPDNPTRPLLKVEKIVYSLGGAGNVAANLASLGAKTFLFGIMGDETGRKSKGTQGVDFARNRYHNSKIRGICSNLGIDLYTSFSGETILKSRAIDVVGGYISRADIGEYNFPKKLGEEEYLEILAEVRGRILGGIDAVVLSDYNKQMFTTGLGGEVIKFCMDMGTYVFVDPKPENIDRLGGATLVRPNLSEARKISGGGRLSVEETTIRLRERAKSKYSVVTLGKEGIAVYDGKKYEVIPTQGRNVADTTGAGDTAIAAITLSMISGSDVFESAQIANYASGVVVEKLGTATITREELVNAI